MNLWEDDQELDPNGAAAREAREIMRIKFEKRMAQEEAKAKIPAWIERGKPMIYPQKWTLWQKCVNLCASGMYHGIELENALDIMEALERGASINEAIKIFESAGHSGGTAGMTFNILVNFSKRGVEFFRAKYYGEFDQETEDFLREIDKQNAEFEKIAQQNAKDANKQNAKTAPKPTPEKEML